jgi:hypothetical protein
VKNLIAAAFYSYICRGGCNEIVVIATEDIFNTLTTREQAAYMRASCTDCLGQYDDRLKFLGSTS